MPRFLLLSRASSDGQSVGFHASVQVQQPMHFCQQGPLRMVGRDIEATLHHNNSGLTNSSAPGLEPGTNEFAGREQPSELFSTPFGLHPLTNTFAKIFWFKLTEVAFARLKLHVCFVCFVCFFDDAVLYGSGVSKWACRWYKWSP